MRIAFVAIVPPRWSVYTKVEAQIAALERMRDLGEIRFLQHLSVSSTGQADHYQFGESHCTLPIGSLAKTLWTIVVGYPLLYGRVTREMVTNGIDVLYVRRPPSMTPITSLWLMDVRRRGIRVLYEVPTYPYDNEFRSRVLKWSDRLSRQFLRWGVSQMVLLTPRSQAFGVAAVEISNAVDLGDRRIGRSFEKGDSVTMTCVSSLEPWHSVHRLLASLEEYLGTGGGRVDAVHIVGDGPERKSLETTVSSSANLASIVKFHGALYGQDLARVMAVTTLGVGNLEEFRCRGLSEVKALKHGEYAAHGIPFVYGLRDPDFANRTYALQLPEGDISMEAIINWRDNLELSPQEIRDDVKDFSWENQFRKVLRP